MTLFLAWTGAELPADLVGPWREVRIAAPGVAFVDSDDTLSRVYHELKWSLPEGSPLLVVPLAQAPKAKGLAPGTQSWVRSRVGAG